MAHACTATSARQEKPSKKKAKDQSCDPWESWDPWAWEGAWGPWSPSAPWGPSAPSAPSGAAAAAAPSGAEGVSGAWVEPPKAKKDKAKAKKDKAKAATAKLSGPSQAINQNQSFSGVVPRLDEKPRSWQVCNAAVSSKQGRPRNGDANSSTETDASGAEAERERERETGTDKQIDTDRQTHQEIHAIRVIGVLFGYLVQSSTRRSPSICPKGTPLIQPSFRRVWPRGDGAAAEEWGSAHRLPGHRPRLWAAAGDPSGGQRHGRARRLHRGLPAAAGGPGIRSRDAP